MRKAQAEIDQRDMAPLRDQDVEKKSKSATERGEDGERQPMEEPHQG
jgi:hypothetical protein